MIDGKPTEVFAFYASPKTRGEWKGDSKVPGIVLIHGGGGTAFSDGSQCGPSAVMPPLRWICPGTVRPLHSSTLKAKRFQITTTRRNSASGSNGAASNKSVRINSTVSEEVLMTTGPGTRWPRAHTLLRSFPEVDPVRTAVTGISWGGYTTCLAASLDDRFKAAVPVYGCGFLHEGESVQKAAIDRLAERREAWITAYDPASYLHKCVVPTFWVNGTHDINYVLDRPNPKR